MKKLTITLLILLFSTANLAAANSETSRDKVIEAIKTALIEKGIDGKLKLDINGYEKGFRLQNELEAYKVYVRDFSLNDKNRLWRAEIAFTTSNNKIEKFQVNGSYDSLITVPVLSQKLPNRAVIREENITMLEIPQRQIQFDTVTDSSELIGQALTRAMQDGTPIKKRDLQKEQVVIRNATVNILYNTATISLKTIGTAVESGGIGDIIKVRNVTSGKIVQAIVQDDQNVAALTQNNEYSAKTAQLNGEGYVR